MVILVLNCGSSSLKFAVQDTESQQCLQSGMYEVSEAGHLVSIQSLIEQLKTNGLFEKIQGIGHRVVHGGEQFSNSCLITDQVLGSIQSLGRLAPLHNPINLIGISCAQTLFPHLPQVAVFDTAFHQSIPQEAYTYAVPFDWYLNHGVRRYGFHGSSHRYIAIKAQGHPLLPKNPNIITIHLGNGCSAAAVSGGKCIDTTMGLTPLEGLVMGTRSGNVDPGLHAYLAEELGLGLFEINQILNKQSGLLGVSGLSGDMRTLIEARSRGHERADLAIKVFTYRLAAQVMALTAPFNKLDALIFTGGIGENSWIIRKEVLQRLQILNIIINDDANESNGKLNQGLISKGSGVLALVIPTNEEAMIAHDSAQVIAQIKPKSSI
jgi:acetate kinase